MKTVYDNIREGDFEELSYMRNSTRILHERGIVINWWCRKSGKTVFCIKKARELSLEKCTDIIFITFSKKMATQAKDFFSRTLKKEELREIIGDQIFLKNGSRITFCSSKSKDHYLKNADMVIFDEFEYFDRFSFMNLLNSLQKRPDHTFWRILLEKLGFVKPVFSQFLIFSSSMKDGANLGALFSRIKNLPMSRVSFKHLPSHDVEKLKTILGEEDWKKEYDSYED